MKLGNRSRWMILGANLMMMLVIFLVRSGPVPPKFPGIDLHAMEVLCRVWNEKMSTTSAGRYYQSLGWKHADETFQILSAQPERYKEFWRVTEMFIPGLEAFVNGEGHSIQITVEQVESLNAELNRYAELGSQRLRDDIKKEQQRFPLDQFVGMTMTDAWNFINSKWTPDMVTQPTATPEAIVQIVATSYVVDHTLVPGSDGKWAYYVQDGVYLEYPSIYNKHPSSYNDQSLNGESFAPAMKSINFYPYEWQDMQQMPYSIEVAIWNGPLADQERLIHVLNSSGSVVWTRTIQSEDFDGIEYVIGGSSGAVVELGAILFNQEDELIVNMFVTGFSPVPSDSDFAVLIDQSYSYFQHMVDHLRMQTP